MTFWAYVIKEGKEIVEVVTVKADLTEDKAFDFVEGFLLVAKGYNPEDIYAIERSN